MPHEPKPARAFASTSAVLAIDPRAFGAMYEERAEAPSHFNMVGDAAVVHVCGPITYSESWFFENYAHVQEAALAAIASPAARVVLHIASPGGDVWGAFECARAIRAAATAAKKPLIAFTDADATSAAYALACVADSIVATDTAVLGSIGVIVVAEDVSEAQALQGIRCTVLTSGARKADGNPYVPMTPEAAAAIQANVDAMASVFFTHVQQHRPQVGDPAALDAGVRIGAAAVTAGLADMVGSINDACAGAILPPDAKVPKGNAAMPHDEVKDEPKAKAEADDKDGDKDGDECKDMTRAALEAAAEGDETDPRVKAAKRALAAYDAEGGPAEEPSAEGESEADAKALTPALLKTIKEQGEQIKALTARAAADERAAVFAAYPNAPAAVVAALKDAPLKLVKATLSALSPGGVAALPPPNPVIALARQPVQGKPGAASVPDHSPYRAAIDNAFGNIKTERVVEVTANGARQTFGVSKVTSNG